MKLSVSFHVPVCFMSLFPENITVGCKLRFSRRKEDEYEDKRQTGPGLFLMKK